MFRRIECELRLRRYRIEAWLGPHISEIYTEMAERLFVEYRETTDPWVRQRVDSEAFRWWLQAWRAPMGRVR